MPGSYCKFCSRRCFLYRIIPSGPQRGWGGHLATCPGGMAYDRQVTGRDHTTAVNPVTDPDAADAACTWTWTVDSLVPVTPRWRLSRPVSIWDRDRTATEMISLEAGRVADWVLRHYLKDAAADAGLRPGEPGSGPCSPLRVTVWPGPQPGERAAAAAVTTWRAGA